jgi:hypothetical protein
MPARVCCGQCHLAMLYATCPIVELAWLQKGTRSGRTTKPRFGVPSDEWTALLRCWSNVLRTLPCRTPHWSLSSLWSPPVAPFCAIDRAPMTDNRCSCEPLRPSAVSA